MSSSPDRISRREVLTRSAQVAALAVVAGGIRPLLAAPASRWFRIGVCDWTLGRQLGPKAFDLAKQIGLEGVQIDMGTSVNGMHLRRPDMQKSYLDAARQTGLEIPSMATGEFNAVRKALDDIDYSGWIVIEAASPHGVLVDQTANQEYLRSIFSAHP
jgi:L-ribulose-5-phosphate 3-epimerase